MKTKNIMLRTTLSFLTIYLLSSCATHHGFLSSNAVLINNDFKIIGLGIGESESLKVLGFGGLKKDALVFDAKNDLYKKVELKQGQALTNITVDFKHEFYFIYSKTKVIVTGEIVDFNSSNDKLSQNYYGLKVRNDFKIGDPVYVKIDGSFKKRVIEKLDLNELQIELLKQDSEILSSLSIKYEDVFRLNGVFDYEKTRYSIGDKIEIEVRSGKTPSGKQNSSEFIGKVIGISQRYALLIDENSKYEVIAIK